MISIPILNKTCFDGIDSSPRRSGVGVRKLPVSPRISHLVSPVLLTSGPHHTETAFPYAEASMFCSKCYSPGEMKRLYILDCCSSILSHACSVCGDLFSESPLIKSISTSCVYPVAHECESCGWRICLKCNMVQNMQKSIGHAKSQIENEHVSKVLFMEQEVRDLQDKLVFATPRRLSECGNVSVCASPEGSPSSDLAQSFRVRMSDLETRLGVEKRTREQTSALLSSIQKEYMQYKTDVEMHLESNAAEQILLQSRLVEQSVLLADARARIDDLTSVQRRDSRDNNATVGNVLSQREAILINENNRLKEEVDLLKVSIHTDFDNWKRTVMKQVKNECIRYRSRLEKNIQHLPTDESPLNDENEKELDFLFDHVDWTASVHDLSPERIKEYITATTPS